MDKKSAVGGDDYFPKMQIVSQNVFRGRWGHY